MSKRRYLTHWEIRQKTDLKDVVHPNILSFTHPNVVAIPFDFLSLAKHKRKDSEFIVLLSLSHTSTMNSAFRLQRECKSTMKVA